MPSHLTGTPMASTWDKVVALATSQGVAPDQPIDASTIPVEELQALTAVGAAEVSAVDGKTMVSLKYMETAVEDMTGAQAAAKKHTFAAAMPSHLTGTPMASTWDRVVALASAQGVAPDQPIDASTIPVEELQALTAVGAAEVSAVDGKTMVSLKYMETAVEDMTGAQAAAKKHTFAQ
jgi:methylmalonyl-CoA mutase cobalamin-binding subunit